MKKILFYSLLIFGIGTSCSKSSGGNTTPPDSSPSDIVIDLPTAGTIVLNGTNLTITGTITDNNNLSQAKVEIRNKTTNALYNSQISSTGTVSFYRYTWNWTVTGITGPTPGIVRVIAVDRYGYIVYKDVDITLDN